MPAQQWLRGPTNELHDAALIGSTARMAALLAKGLIDMDQADLDGWTPLMFAAYRGHHQVTKMLLNKGANMSVVADDGRTALLLSAAQGHLAVTKLLVNAGADLEQETSLGSTALHLAVESGLCDVMGVLIQAGANVNSCRRDGATLLYTAAEKGHVNATKALLRAKANALLFRTDLESGATYLPLDAAAQCGHSEVARELVQQLGMEGCGGASGGVNALRLAARGQYVDIMTVLTDAGVIDTGVALVDAAECGRLAAIKFLLQQQQKRKADTREGAYANATDPYCGTTPLMVCIAFCRKNSPKVVRSLVDAGADTTSAVRITTRGGGLVLFDDTPLSLVVHNLGGKKIQGQPATKKQLYRLAAIRRLLLQTDAVHAVSWGWGIANPVTPQGTGADMPSRGTSTALTSMCPILRQRARRPRVLVAAICRWVPFVERCSNMAQSYVRRCYACVYDQCWWSTVPHLTHDCCCYLCYRVIARLPYGLL